MKTSLFILDREFLHTSRLEKEGNKNKNHSKTIKKMSKRGNSDRENYFTTLEKY